MISLRPISKCQYDHQPNSSRRKYIPIAVNLLRICKIIITSMTKATICMKEAAPWKIMVLASSMFRA